MLAAPIIGFCFGFFGSVPVAGPVAALVLDRGLKRQFRSGFAIALGGAIPEAVYAFLAFWGFSELLKEYAWIQPVARGASAVILIGLAFVFLKKGGLEPKKIEEGLEPVRRRGPRWLSSFLLGFSITAMNPTLIATWTAAVTFLPALGFGAYSLTGGLAFAISASIGIVAWFGTMLWIIHRLHERFDHSVLDNIRRAMGVLLLAVGAWFLITLVQSFL
jgi:threonine/homoserine/homoserine lactone efflux protein